MRTSPINTRTEKGRHTTTYSKLINLGEGLGCIIDTPGIQEITAFKIDSNNETFFDIEQLTKKCKYRNCSHTSDDGCALVQALEEGLLDKEHFKNYRKLLNESGFMESRLDYIASRNRRVRILQREEQQRNSTKRDIMF